MRLRHVPSWIVCTRQVSYAVDKGLETSWILNVCVGFLCSVQRQWTPGPVNALLRSEQVTVEFISISQLERLGNPTRYITGNLTWVQRHTRRSKPLSLISHVLDGLSRHCYPSNAFLVSSKVQVPQNETMGSSKTVQRSETWVQCMRRYTNLVDIGVVRITGKFVVTKLRVSASNFRFYLGSLKRTVGSIVTALAFRTRIQ